MSIQSKKPIYDLIDIYSDGPTLDEIATSDRNIVKGYTFNPSLFKNLGVTNYLKHCKKVINHCDSMPVSLEVFADSKDDMIRQARLLKELGKNINIKIPITYTNGETTLPVIQALVEENTKLNITAIFTKEQVEGVVSCLKNAEAIISVFSGRIFDIGYDAVKVTQEIAKIVHGESNCSVLWASPRMVYDVKNAHQAECDIITMRPDLIKKLALFNKSPEEFSLDTVKMFFNDAVSSEYTL
jgi:transaldolase